MKNTFEPPSERTAGSAGGNPMLHGSLARAIWQMSWPLLVTYLLSSCIGLTDTYLGSFIGGSAQAALGIGEQFIFLSVVIGTGLSIGTVACVARSFGAGKLELAQAYSRESLILSGIIGLAAAVCGIAAAGPLFPLFSADPEVSRQGVRYLAFCSIGNFPFVIAMCQAAVFRAVGAPRYALCQGLLISLLSIGGSFLLFFGDFGVGHRSLDALCISWMIGASTGVIFGFLALNRFWGRLVRKNPQVFDSGEVLARMAELLKIGGPAVIAEIVWTTSNFLTYKIFAILPHSAQVQAGWSIAMKVEETCATLPLLALSMAAATIVGQNLGAGSEARARKSAWKIAVSSTVAMMLVGIALMAFGNQIATTLSRDVQVIACTTALLKAAPLTVPALAIWLVLFGALEGAGCTWTPMVCNSLLYMLVRLPLYWILALPLKLGFAGIVAALVATRLLVALVAAGAFRRGFVESAPALPAIPEWMTQKARQLLSSAIASICLCCQRAPNRCE